VRRALSLLLVSIAALGAACGGGGGTAPPAVVVPPPPPTPAPVARPRPRAIWIGDSLAARGWRGVAVATQPGNFVVDADPVSPRARLTTVAPHGVLAGHYVQIANPGDDSYAAPLNGRVVRVLETPTAQSLVVAAQTPAGLMPAGDYSAGYAGQPWLLRTLAQGTDESWLQWLNVLMNGHFEIVASYAIGGARSSVAARLMQAVETGPAADVAFVQTCTNDVNAVQPPAIADCVANLERVLDVLRARGVFAFVATPPAIGDRSAQPGDPASPEKGAALAALRDQLNALRQRRADFVLLDVLAASADPADPWLRFRPGFAPADGIHPSSFGALEIARSVLPQVLAWTDAADWLIRNSGDPNLLANGSMNGSGGSIAADAAHQLSGTMPDGWSARGQGATAQRALQARLSGDGTSSGMPARSLDVDIVAAAAGQTLEFGSNGAGGASFHAALSPGRWYRCGAELRARSALTAVQMHGQVFLARGAAAPAVVQFMVPTAPAFANGMRLEPGEPLRYVSQPFPAGEAYTGAWLFLTLRFSDTVSDQRLSIGRATCREVPDPYA